MTTLAPVTIQNLTCNYKTQTVLDNISVELGLNEVVTVLGPNGAGKTTLIKTILGRKKIQQGQVQVFGNAPGTPLSKRQIGVMLQVAALPQLITVKEHIELFRSYYCHPLSLEDVLNITDIGDLRNKRSGQLSGGERQRVLFALALCGNPKLLVLDEPTVGMDIMSRRQLWEVVRELKKRGVCVLLTTHYLEEADTLSDRIIVLNKGKIIKQGSPQSIKQELVHQTIKCNGHISECEIANLPAVVASKQNDNNIHITTSDATQTLRGLFNQTNSISNLTVSDASLEEAFVAIATDINKASTNKTSSDDSSSAQKEITHG